MIEIRPAQLQDLPEILSVLKAGLGEGMIKKNQEIWDYKHTKNPFGKSLVWVGIVDKKIVGVRAFMQWQWQKQNQIYKTYRAVDTATHPDFQGRGIFKKLTLKAVEEAAKTHRFVFNTPNNKSRPGYLKMGWEIVDKIQLKLIPAFFYQFNFLQSKDHLKYKEGTGESLKNLCHSYNEKKAKQNQIFTHKNPEFLEWRYEKNPIQKYQIYHSERFYIAIYVKKHKLFNEARVSECIYDKINGEHKKSIQRIIVNFARQNKCQLISINDREIFGKGFYGKFGPILTIKNLNLDNKIFQSFSNIDHWNYTLGDLELF